MGRKQAKRTGAEFALFDVLYEDGSRSSNRRLPSAELDELDGEVRARAIIEAQDREIAQRSGRPRPEIKSITRSRTR